MKKLIKKLVSVVAVLTMAVSLFTVAKQPQTASAAVKRTPVVTKLLSDKGKLYVADWTNVGAEEKISISNNGSVFKVTNAAWPGKRLFTQASAPANTGYYVEFDVIKTNPATTKVNFCGYCPDYNGAKSNIYLSSIGIDPGLGTNYGVNGDGASVWNLVNSTLNEGYRYRVWYRINPDDNTRGDIIIYRKELGVENAQWVEGCVLYKLCTIDPEQAHIAEINIEGDIIIDNFAFTLEDGTEIQSCAFENASDVGAAVVAGKMYANGGAVVNDTGLTIANFAETDKIMSWMEVEVDDSLENAFEANASIKVESTAGKVGFALGVAGEDTKVTDNGVSFLYFENGATSTSINVIKDGEAGTPVDLGILLNDDFHKVALQGKSNGDLLVYVDGELKATYENQNFNGYFAIMTDGTEGAKATFLPEFTVNTYALDLGTGVSLENNFNTGYINPANYEVASHGAVTLGGNGKGISVQDGVLMFDGTSDGAQFAITNGTYADFILQFDWINFAWSDRPTKEDGTVSGKEKPAEGYATELYSPLGVAFSKVEPMGGWTSGKLLRFFDDYNLIQVMNFDEKGGATNNFTMGTSFADKASITNIQEGKINFYEETVNLKIVARNGKIDIYGVIMEDGQPVGEHKLLASDVYENCTGYISISTTEAGYFGIDNLRLTNIDGWTDDQVNAYENFKAIADEAAPVKLNAPVAQVEGKVVSWTAVENATKYAVSVNGGEAVEVEGTSYEVTETEAGSYVVSIVAIGDGENYLDSDAGEATVVIEAEGGNESTPESTPEEDKESNNGGNAAGGCGGSIGGLSSLAVVLLGSVLVVAKKKND